MDQPKNFLERLQSSDEATKQRWLIGSAVVIMVAVVFLWLTYFNSFVIGPRNGAPAEAGQKAEGSGVTFFGTMKSGAFVLYQGFWGKLRAFGSILEKPREYIIKPPSAN